MVIVYGEAGVGKTRLLSELRAETAAFGMVSAAGRATEDGGAYRVLADALLTLERSGRLPAPAVLEPFAGMVGTMIPAWARPSADTAPGDRSLLLSEALVRLLRAVGEAAPVLLLLDDLQWVDADTRPVLDRLTDVIGEVPALLVLAVRDQVPDPLAELSRRVAHVLRLPRLSPSETKALVDACGQERAVPRDVRDRLAERAEGLPLLVEELVGALIASGGLTPAGDHWQPRPGALDAVPRSISATVQGQLAALSEKDRTVVEAAALIGREIAWPLLVTSTGHSEQSVMQSVQSALECGLFSGGFEHSSTVQFRHGLIREAVVGQMLPPRRAALARRAAQAVEDLGVDLLLAAALREQAGQHDRAAALLVEVGREPGGALGMRQEALRRAIRLAPDHDSAAVALVQVLALAGQAAEAREEGDPLLARLRAGDPRRAELALTLARACHIAARPEEALSYLRLAGGGEAVGALAAHVAFAQQRPNLARRFASSVVRSKAPEVRCEALEILGRVARLENRRSDAERAFTEGLLVASRNELPVWQARALHECGTLDLLGPARSDRLETARQFAVQTGQLATVAVIDVQLAALHGLRMDHPACLAAASRAVDVAEVLRLPALAGAGMVFMATARGHTGAFEEMHALLDEAESRLADDLDKLAAARLARGTQAMLAHDLPAWRSAMESGMELLRQNPTASPSPQRGLHALLETVLGDGSLAREDLRRSGATVQACNEGALAYADAVASARAGEDPAATLQRAEAVMRPLPWRRHHMHLLVAPAAFEHGWGSPEEWLREAEDHFTSTGDVALAAACRRALREAGVPVPRRGRGDSVVPPHLRRQGVTSREMDVLLLVAGGLTNREVAERLVLSPRTVETHVGNLLSKTGAPSRAELVTAVGARKQPSS